MFYRKEVRTLDEEILFAKAVKHYYAQCERLNAIPQEPSWADSEIKENVVYLRNVNGILAWVIINGRRTVGMMAD